MGTSRGLSQYLRAAFNRARSQRSSKLTRAVGRARLEHKPGVEELLYPFIGQAPGLTTAEDGSRERQSYGLIREESVRPSFT
jgi:hypothetical protein